MSHHWSVLIAIQTLILGDRMARVKSVTLMLSRWHTFWAAGGETRESYWRMLEGLRKWRVTGTMHSKGRLQRWNVRTGVIRHGGLVRVTLLLEGHVPQLQHGRHHLQHTWQTIRRGHSVLQMISNVPPRHSFDNLTPLKRHLENPLCAIIKYDYKLNILGFWTVGRKKNPTSESCGKLL